ncbi:hypothetical protein Tco_0096754 [Tanacetum coccineum]
MTSQPPGKGSYHLALGAHVASTRTNFASWQQRIRLYCRGKENGVNILKSIDEGPFQMGTFRETLTEGAPHLGPKRLRVYSDLSPEDKDMYNADIQATNILLQELPKDIYSLVNHYTDAKDRESQLYDDFEHFRQNKGETIHDYYVRFSKLINDMRNIKMTMSRMQLNSTFVNNMLPEWGRFVTAVKLNRGLRDSNYDQLYAYLKQHEAHANENKMMLDRFTQHTVDPLALMSNNPNPLNELNKAIPEENPVIPDPNQVVDVYNPNEMVDISEDVDLVAYDGDDEENPEEDPEEDSEEEPEPNNGLVNRFAPHVDPHQPGVMIGWLEENDGVNEGVNNEDIEDEDVKIELNNDDELIFPYEVEDDKTPLPGGVSSNAEPPNAEPPNSESEDEEADIAILSHLILSRRTRRLILHPGPLNKERLSARDSSYVGGLAPWALRRDLETSCLRARLTEAELSTNQAEIALLKSKNKIEKKERELLDHDLGDVERTLGNVLERLKVLESGENATLKKRFTKTETKLAWARMKHDIAKGRLHESRVWNKRFYMEMVRIGVVPKLLSDDEGTKRPRKKSKKSSFDGANGPSELRGPPSDS